MLGLKKRFELLPSSCVSVLSFVLMCCSWLQVSAATISLKGEVLDTDGKPVSHARVTFYPLPQSINMVATTVFSNATGKFIFPAALVTNATDDFSVMVNALNYDQLSLAKGKLSVTEHAQNPESGVIELTVVMQHQANQALAAPASAWLKDVPNTDAKGKLLVDCVNCHQFPSPEVHNFIHSLNSIGGAESEQIRKQAWHEKIDHMSAIFADALARGRAGNESAETVTAPASQEFFNHQDADEIIELLITQLSGGSEVLEGYEYGAPLAVTEKTVIREYQLQRPNAIREAISLGTPPQLWVADFYGDRVVRVDVASGAQKEFAVPFDRASGPHTLVRGKDDSLWLSGVFNSFIGQLDPISEKWRIWSLKTQPPVSPHDLTYNFRNELAMDTQGRIWFSDIANNALGSFNPATGAELSFPASVKAGRKPGEMSMYGIVMTSDQHHICYTQLGGDFGCFNTETLGYETTLALPIGAGPRRMAITENDIIYIPLFGAGQLVEYDARTKTKTATYDLPDRASGPYAATWDVKRRVVWIATSNADVIYRFDPEKKIFGVIPLPRQKAYLRMLAVDPNSGQLVTSYANLPEPVNGPRMAVMIDPGN